MSDRCLPIRFYDPTVSRMSSFIVALCVAAQVALVVAMGAKTRENESLRFRNWNTQDGLPHNRVRSVIRTRDGFIWLATDGGAVRFDGMNFKSLGLEDGLPAAVVLALKESDDGTLWMGTLGGGVCAYRNGRIDRVYTSEHGLPSNWISGIDIDAEGALIVGALTGMARMVDGRFVRISPNSETDVPIVGVVQDLNGVRFGLESGRYFRCWKDGKWRADKTIGPERVEAMVAGLAGDVWVAVGNRLWKWNQGEWHGYQIPAKEAQLALSLAVDTAGTLWLAYNRKELLGLKDGRFFTPALTGDFLPDMVESVVATDDGQVWLTSSEGLFRITNNHIEALTIDDPAAPRVSNNIGGLVETAPEEFLIASQGSGFYKWQGGHTKRLNDDPLLASGVYGNILLRGQDGTIWLGSSKGLYGMSMDEKVLKYRFPRDEDVAVWALCETKEGLWIGCGRGQLFLLKNGTMEAVRYDRSGEGLPIRAIMEDANKDLWLGTRGNGLFTKKNGEWQRLGRESGLLSEVIRTLYLDPQNSLWVGTDGGGLSLRSAQRFVSVTMRNGLPSDSVSQIVMDDGGRLWLGTHRGLAVLDQQAVNAIASGNAGDLHPLLINRTDGLPAEEFTIVPPVKASDGSYAFASVRGFLRLKPKDFQVDESQPQVYIERVTANGDEVSAAGGKIQLPAGTERLEFQFTGLFFTDPGRLRFRNRLCGVESEWAYVGARRSADYRNLGPGTYHFDVEASIGNGLWSASPGRVSVTIPPHFWQSTWFGISLALASFGLIAWIIRRIERNRARLQIEIFKRRRAVDSERARIARDLHDDVGAGLTQMALQSQLAERNIISQPELASRSMQDVFKSARNMTRALDEIIWTVNPAHDSLENFISFLGSFTQDYTEGAGLRCRFDLPDEIPDRIMPATFRHHLYLSSKEILHNVIKHAEATEVTLKVCLDNGFCRIVISDNGRGLGDLPSSPGADGLKNLQIRLARLGGTCRRYNADTKGTSIELEVGMDWRNEYQFSRRGRPGKAVG